ncbi:MAG TPA: sulfotransferase [Dongiaceae bacterium]
MAGQDLHKIAMKAYAKGDLATAQRFYEKLIRLAPGDFNALHMLGVIRAGQKRFKEAENHIAKALLYGRSAEALSNHGNVLSELGRHEEAVRQLTQATLINPRSAQNHFNLGNAQVKATNLSAATKAFGTAISLQPDFTEALQNYADALRELGRPNEALALLKRALALRPDDAELQIVFGSLLQEIGAIEESKQAMANALRHDPSAVAAYYHLARAEKMGPQDSLLARMEALDADRDSVSAKSRAMLDFALAKAYDDIGRYEDSFARLSEANRLVRGEVPYDEAGERHRLERLRDAFTPKLFEGSETFGCLSEAPVFIVGFPRSGTTLTEQILASHPAVHGAGEKSILSNLVSSNIVRLERAGRTALTFPESVAELPKERFRLAGDQYARELGEVAPGALRITDKLPANFMFIGFIRMILPRARIIHVRRNPMDTCLSCYFQRFRKDNIPFSYELGQLGRYYRMYLDLMTHWRHVLPAGSFAEVQYEDLVGELEGEARLIVEFCGLPWNDRCLSFHRTERSVRTASVAQVRQPLYRSSIARWRRYEKFLAPLIEAIAEPLEPPLAAASTPS